MPKLSLASTETLALTTTVASEIRDTQGVKMRLVSVGEFTMGSNAADALIECQKYAQDCQRDWFFPEEPPHSINLSAFYMDVYEVTNARYQACVIAGACTAPHETSSYTRSSYYGDDLYDNYPVIYIDWNQAKTYCEWRGARLPSEAEWEKAARGTTKNIYPWGDTFNSAWANTFELGAGQPVAVATHSAASPYGAFDMIGNVWEWVQDWYGGGYYAQSPRSNPTGPATGIEKVIRGGSFKNESDKATTSVRGKAGVDNRGDDIGFRCAKS
jgi:formylglycine-generating enzyme required for sulfatase activity